MMSHVLHMAEPSLELSTACSPATQLTIILITRTLCLGEIQGNAQTINLLLPIKILLL